MKTNTPPSTVSFGETSLTLIDRDGVPYLAARDLARALGYSDASSVLRIHARRKDEFTEEMSPTVNLTVGKNQVEEVRVFSPRGCHLVAMFARTERAAAFRRWVLDVLEGLAQPKTLPTTITPTQQQHLKELVDLIAESGAQAHAETWARLHRKFNIPRYAELPAAQFDAACAYLKGKIDEPRLAHLVQKHLPHAAPAPEPSATLDAHTLYRVWFLCNHFKHLYRIYRDSRLYQHLTGLGSPVGAQMHDHFLEGSHHEQLHLHRQPRQGCRHPLHPRRQIRHRVFSGRQNRLGR